MPALALEPTDPRRLGRFRLLGRLGEGGQGVVYLGEGAAGERVAVKVLKAGADPQARDRLSREMAAAMRVAPFCTARVIDSSVDGPLPYIVSEYVDGPSLQERVSGQGPLYDGDLDRLMVSTARALRAIHRVGVVHRDLKPANILLGPDGPRVVDFGIARAIDADTATQMVGTPAYFAPEWLRNQPPTPASDVFAWAGTMVFAATGRPPFGLNTNLHALLHRVANDDPDLSGVPLRLRALLEECLDKDPAGRPTAADVDERLLDAHVGGEAQRRPGGQATAGWRDVTQLPAGPPVPPSPSPSPAGRQPAQETLPPRNEAMDTSPRPPAPPSDAGPASEPSPPAPPSPAPPSPEPLSSEPRSPAPSPVGPPPPEAPLPADPPGRRRVRRGPLLLGLLGLLVAIGLIIVARPHIFPDGTADTTIPAAYEGTWSGSVVQGEGFDGQRVTITISMQAGSRTALLKAGPEGCTGELALREARSGDLTFEPASSQCRASTVSLGTQSDGSTLDFHASGGTYTASGTLTRGGG